jgi:hypothetical protein
MVDDLEAQNTANFIYDDCFTGKDFLALKKKGYIMTNNTCLAFSIDGTQLYQNKKSDMWIAIWTIFDISPDGCYKQGGIGLSTIIPGPNKPKMIDSYFYRTLHHFSALQQENGGVGFAIWDSLVGHKIYSHLILCLGTANAVELTELDGHIGHHGASGCCLECLMKGRHKL